MAVNEFTGTTNEKSNTGTNWTLGLPKATQDLVIPESKKIKVEGAVLKGRSLLVRKGVTISGALGAEIGNAEKPEGPAGANWILKVEGGVTINWSAELVLNSTWTEPLKIGWLSQTTTSTTVTPRGTGTTYILAESSFVGASLELHEGIIFKTEGFGLTVQNTSFGGSLHLLSGAGTNTFNFANSTISTGEWFSDVLTAITVTGSTIVIHDGVRGFFEGTKTYNNITIEGGRPVLRSSYTNAGILALNRTNGFEGVNYIAFAEGKTITLPKGATITTNGTSENHAKLKSVEEAAEPKAPKAVATLHLEEDIEVTGGWLDLEGIEVTGVGSLYVPKGAAFGTLANGSKVKFEAKPSGENFARAAADTITVGETVVRTSVLPRVAGDTVAIGESAARAVAVSRSAADAITVSEATVRTAANVRAVADAITLSEAAVRAPSPFVRTAGDTITVSESALRSSPFSRTAADLVTVGTGVTFEVHTGGVEHLARITISPRKQVSITVSPYKQVTMTLEARKQVIITVDVGGV